PTNRARGWSRCRKAIKARRFHCSIGDSRPLLNEGPKAQRVTCTIKTISDSANRGQASARGFQRLPMHDKAPKPRTIKYHSGIIGSDSTSLGTGSDSDWKDAVPHWP